jgi:PAS domain S-box-containing protein
MRSNMRFRNESNSDVEFFQQLADGAPVLIWMSGIDMGCFYFNRAWLDYRGRTTEQEFGNGWAEGVHPDDLERCVQHYTSAFKQRLAFAMSYRLRHHTGEYRSILDRGVPHYTPDGRFLGFFGGCVETSADACASRAVSSVLILARIEQLRLALDRTRHFAERLAEQEAELARHPANAESLEAKMKRLASEHRGRHHAAEQISELAADMRTYDRIPDGVCLL